MVDYHPIRSNNWKLPDRKPEAEEDQEELHPTVDVVLNVYREKNNAQSIALRISFRLPEKA
jgi:hypothetical protein